MSPFSTRRTLLVAPAWTPAKATDEGYMPDHWYKSDEGLWTDVAGTTAAFEDGTPIARWDDLTTNADPLTQAVAGSRPQTQCGAGNELNGHRMLRFDGADDYLQGAFTTGGNMAHPFTIFVVAKLDAVAVNDGNDHDLIDDDNNIGSNLIFADSVPAPDEWGIFYGATVNGNATDGNWNIWTVLGNGANSQFWHNGVSEGLGNANSQVYSGFTVGAQANGLEPWDGDVMEIIAYDVNLSDADKNQVGRYLAKRYNLTYTDI